MVSRARESKTMDLIQCVKELHRSDRLDPRWLQRNRSENKILTYLNHVVAFALSESWDSASVYIKRSYKWLEANSDVSISPEFGDSARNLLLAAEAESVSAGFPLSDRASNAKERESETREKKILSTRFPVAFVDIDDTLIRSMGTKRIPMPNVVRKIIEAKEEGMQLYCWSSGGAEYAERSASELKIHHLFEGFLPKPTLMVDDRTPDEWRYLKCLHPNQVTSMTGQEIKAAACIRSV